MPDKHEVGGSSPLGPTSRHKSLHKLNKSDQRDLVLSSSEIKIVKGKMREELKRRRAKRGKTKAFRER